MIAVSLLLYIGGTASAASPRESKIFTGGVPEDIFENSYQIGVLPSGNEVRKYRTDDGKSVYMIAHQSFQNKVKCYYLLAQDNLTGYLMFLNQLEKEFGSADDDTQFKEGGMDLGSEDLNRMLSNNDEFLVVNERLLPEAVFINIWRNPYLYNKQVSLTYHLDAHYDIPGTYVSDEGHVVFDIGYRNDLSSLRDILIKSMLSNGGGINPDSFERLGTYSVPSIWGPDYPEEIRSILRYGTGESAKYYIQGTSRVINEKKCDTYIWLKKENLEPFVNWLRTIHKEFVKSTSKKTSISKKSHLRNSNTAAISRSEDG